MNKNYWIPSLNNAVDHAMGVVIYDGGDRYLNYMLIFKAYDWG